MCLSGGGVAKRRSREMPAPLRKLALVAARNSGQPGHTALLLSHPALQVLLGHRVVPLGFQTAAAVTNPEEQEGGSDDSKGFSDQDDGDQGHEHAPLEVPGDPGELGA